MRVPPISPHITGGTPGPKREVTGSQTARRWYSCPVFTAARERCLAKQVIERFGRLGIKPAGPLARFHERPTLAWREQLDTPVQASVVKNARSNFERQLAPCRPRFIDACKSRSALVPDDESGQESGDSSVQENCNPPYQQADVSEIIQPL